MKIYLQLCANPTANNYKEHNNINFISPSNLTKLKEVLSYLPITNTLVDIKEITVNKTSE